MYYWATTDYSGMRTIRILNSTPWSIGTSRTLIYRANVTGYIGSLRESFFVVDVCVFFEVIIIILNLNLGGQFWLSSHFYQSMYRIIEVPFILHM